METSGLFKEFGFSTKQRMILFYAICIPLRTFILPYLAHVMHTSLYPNIVLIILGLISIWNNWRTLHKNVWWNRKVHLMFSLLFVFATIGTSLGSKYPSTILIFDVVFGLIYSHLVSAFKNPGNLSKL